MDWQSTLAAAEYWHWAVAGLLLLALEVFAPGAIFMWLGIAALVIAAILAMIPTLSWEWQWSLFSVLSVASIIGWRIFFRRHPLPDEHSPRKLNQRGKELVGRVVTLSQPIENGIGRTQLGDSWWRIEGPDLPAGSKVKIVDSRGSSLVVVAEEDVGASAQTSDESV
jgi:hypothetical protein